MDETRANYHNASASIRNLEHQVREISKLLAEITQGSLPSNTETNPKEHVNAISLRSGKELESSKQFRQQPTSVVQPSNGASSVSKDQSNDPIYIPNYSPSSNIIHFRQRLRKQKLDKQFSKFLNMF